MLLDGVTLNAQVDIVAVFGVGCAVCNSHVPLLGSELYSLQVPMSYYNTLLLYTVGPLIIIATIFLVYKMSSDQEPAWNVAMSRLQFYIFLLYPLCSAVVFQAFNCREIMGTSYLIADLASPCYDNTWVQYSLLAIVGILVYPIGAFVYTYTCLKRNRHKLYLEVVL